MVLICISMAVNDIEHPHMLIGHFDILFGWLVFFLFSWSSLYILNESFGGYMYCKYQLPFWDLHLYSFNSVFIYFVLIFMNPIRRSHPRICYFSMKIILNWRTLRNSRHRKSFLPSPFFLKAGHTFPLVKVTPFPILGRRERFSSRRHLSLWNKSY